MTHRKRLLAELHAGTARVRIMDLELRERIEATERLLAALERGAALSRPEARGEVA